MNRTETSRTFFPKLVAAALLLPGLAAAAPSAPQRAAPHKPAASTPKPAPTASAPSRPAAAASTEDFYIIVSVNQAQKSLVLKLPTEVTTVMTVSDQTIFLDEYGKRIGFADVHAGDTVYVVHRHLAGLPAAAGNEEAAVRIRKGPMTVQELHRRYVAFS